MSQPISFSRAELEPLHCHPSVRREAIGSGAELILRTGGSAVLRRHAEKQIPSTATPTCDVVGVP